jgi:hypothetical protein
MISGSVPHELIAVCFETGSSKKPATLELVWFDNELERNKYVTLTGKKARQLSHLVAGDMYYEAPSTE